MNALVPFRDNGMKKFSAKDYLGSIIPLSALNLRFHLTSRPTEFLLIVFQVDGKTIYPSSTFVSYSDYNYMMPSTMESYYPQWPRMSIYPQHQQYSRVQVRTFYNSHVYILIDTQM